jgi:DNA-binding CsgD family transcriptional regulator
VEHAHLEVRDRLQGSLPLAEAALDAARSAGVELLRARSTVGAAQLYEGHPDWEATLRQVRADAAEAGDLEVEANVTYHVVSGLGFHGRLHEAVDLGATALERLTRVGLGTWITQFRCAHLIQQAVISLDSAAVAEGAERFLHEHRLFRNRGQVHLALLLALLDRGEFDEAREALVRMKGDGLDSPEGVVHVAAAQAEVAWHTGDVDMAAAAVTLGRTAGDAWFGLRLLGERTAMYVLTGAGLPAEVDLPSFAMPTFWPALHELEGLRRRSAGDLPGAADELRRAADSYEGMGIVRWAVRAGLAAVDCDAAQGDRTAPARRRHYAGLARRSGLVGTLRRLGIPVRDELTPAEESILRHVARGCTTREIATSLRIAPGTVDQHIKAARIKLGAATRAEAALLVDG